MLLSIITPCLNRAKYIEEAIQSVLKQDYPAIEHIVMDGGSTDGTLEVLRRYPHLKVISEPDRGLYDALNKGIALSNGDVIGHLNSDDFYLENVFGEIMALFQKDPELEAVFGGAIVFEEDERGERRKIADYSSPESIQLSLDNVTIGVPIINARFFRKSLYRRVGLYDIGYKIAADREFLVRVSLANIKATTVDGVVYCYRQHSDSLTYNPRSPFLMDKYREYLDIAERYLNKHALNEELAIKCRLWHRRETIQACLRAIIGGDFHNALEYGLRGFRHYPLWPARFLWYALQRGIKKFIRELGK